MKKKIYYSLISLMILNMIGQTILLFYYNGNLLNFLSLALSGFVIVIYIALFSNKLYSDKPVCKKCKNTGIIKNNLGEDCFCRCEKGDKKYLEKIIIKIK